jgi:hypothetical protein
MRLPLARVATTKMAKLGAVLYVAWGLLHIKAALDGFALGASQPFGLVQGKLNQGAWDLLAFALAAIAIAVFLNWKNDRTGYWVNLLMVSAADLGFIIFVLIPGHVGLFPGVLGPIAWSGAAVASTLAYLDERA